MKIFSHDCRLPLINKSGASQSELDASGLGSIIPESHIGFNGPSFLLWSRLSGLHRRVYKVQHDLWIGLHILVILTSRDYTFKT